MKEKLTVGLKGVWKGLLKAVVRGSSSVEKMASWLDPS